MKLPIYYRPVKVKLKTPAKVEGADSTSLSSEPVYKTYDSFQIAFYEAGRWRTARAPTLKKAKAKGRQIAMRLAENGADVADLSHAERRIYVSAKNILQPYNLEVDTVARLVADLLQRLDGASLQQAVDFFNAHGRRIIPGATTEQIYTTYLEHLHRRGVGKHHLRDVKKFIGAFVEAFPVEMTAIRTNAIDDWLAGLFICPREMSTSSGSR